MTSHLSLVLAALITSSVCLAQPATCDAKSFCVGASKAEITAPPGFPTGGHGPAGNVARGSWSRNWARAFVIKDPSGAFVILVSCDTFAVPLSLTKSVWEKIKAEPALTTLKPEGLLIAATHTHQGAGNYLDASAYNTLGSARGGFSRPLFDFLVGQVKDAVIVAAGKMRPSTVRLYQGTIKAGFDEPFLVNRSPATFVQSWDAARVLHESGTSRPTRPARKSTCRASRRTAGISVAAPDSGRLTAACSSWKRLITTPAHVLPISYSSQAIRRS